MSAAQLTSLLLSPRRDRANSRLTAPGLNTPPSSYCRALQPRVSNLAVVCVEEQTARRISPIIFLLRATEDPLSCSSNSIPFHSNVQRPLLLVHLLVPRALHLGRFHPLSAKAENPPRTERSAAKQELRGSQQRERCEHPRWVGVAALCARFKPFCLARQVPFAAPVTLSAAMPLHTTDAADPFEIYTRL